MKITNRILSVVAGMTIATSLCAQINTFPGSGNVGIGTTTPTVPLEVKTRAVAGFPAIRIADYIDDGGLYAQSVSGGNYRGIGTSYYYNTGQFKSDNTTAANIDLDGGRIGFYTDSGLSAGTAFTPTQRMIINSSGNIGIGTSLPAAKLDINNAGANGSTALSVTGGGNTSQTAVVVTNYPAITSSGTNYIRNVEFYSKNLPIAAGVTDSGYRIGLDIENFCTDPNFAGTLNEQIGVWARVGSYTGGAGTIENSIAIYLDNIDGSATVGNKYGLFQSNQTAKNYFAGNVGIGTTNPTQKLSVNGTVRAKEVIVDSGWSDYVFDKSYKLKALSETEAFIEAEKHLPGMPSATEVAEHGVSLGEMQAKLLAKIEELTLHVIEQEKRQTSQEAKISSVMAKNARLQEQLRQLRATSAVSSADAQ